MLVQTLAGAVSVGTELPQYTGSEREIISRPFPRMTGYESLGRVLARGDAVREVAVGERVVAFYGHRTHAVVPAAKVIPVPENISDEVALLAILSCDVAKGVRKLAPRPEERVLVTGAGAIGLLAIWLLRAYGVQSVGAVEPRAERRDLARALGAERAYTPGSGDLPAAESYPVGIECSSRDAAFALLQRSLSPGGRLCVVADGNLEPLTLTPAFHRNELTIVASSDGWDYQQHAAWFFREVHDAQRDHPDLARLFEADIPIDHLPTFMERMASGEVAPVKVLTRY